MVTFRIYLPKAKTVYLAGTFNNWSTSLDPLTKNSNGVWYIHKILNKGTYQYKYVVDGTNWIADPNSIELTNDGLGKYNSIVRVGEDTIPTTHLWIDNPLNIVMYLLHIYEFANSTNGDCFDKIINKISYLKELGINCLQFNIINQSTYSGIDLKWGYGVTFWRSIKYQAGSAKKFKELVNLLHQNNISVILDVELDLGSIISDIYKIFPEWFTTNTEFGINVLNVTNIELKYYIYNSLKSFVDNFGIDGFRLDSIHVTKNNALEYYKWITSKLKSEYPEIFFTYETGDISFQPGNPTNMLTYTEVDSGWDMYLKYLLNGSKWFEKNFDSDFTNSPGILFGNLSNEGHPIVVILASNLNSHYANGWPQYRNNKPLIISAGTHDEEKISVTNKIAENGYVIRLNDYTNLIAKLAASFILTIPGIPLIYNGNEFGDSSMIKLDSPNFLTSFDIDLEVLSHYKKVINIRNNYSEFRTLEINNIIAYSEENCLSFTRGNRFLCIFNFVSNSYDLNVKFPSIGIWSNLLSDNEILNIDNINKNIVIKGYESKIYYLIN